MQVIRTIAELDTMIERCNEAERISDDAMRAVFGTFRMEPPAYLPKDPFSAEYRQAQLALYEAIAGRPYDVANEVTAFDVAAAVERPFPFNTRSTATAGDHFQAIGFLLRGLQLPPGARVLEFGPGWGNTTIQLAQLGFAVTAVDIEPHFCELLRRRAEQQHVPLTVVQDEFLWAERCTDQFDLVIFFECFHHCADHLRLLRALHRVLAPGGKIIFAAEPIQPDLPMPWGVRLDGNSLWAIRKNGWLELGFQERYFVEALAHTGWAARRDQSRDIPWLTVWHATRMNEPLLSFSAADPKLHTTCGRRDGGAMRFDQVSSGTAIYGPYIDLPAGRYRARLLFQPDAPLVGQVVMDIACNAGQRIILQQRMTLQPQIELNFNLPCDTRQIEIRLFPQSEMTATLLAVELWRE